MKTASVSARKVAEFRREVRRHFRNRRRAFPWRSTRNPYRILASEVMLQQTQASRVVPKYREFVKRFPDFAALHRAPLREVLRVWQGLGYNRRALALKKIARIVTEEYGGKLPKTAAELEKLPGIGEATAAAVCAYAYNQPVVFIETNIRRAFIYHFFSGSRCKKFESTRMPRKDKQQIHDSDILPIVERTIEGRHPREWYWALMDYGAMLGAAHRGSKNPNRRSRHYAKAAPFRGSTRELRGKILKLLIERRSLTVSSIAKILSKPQRRVEAALRSLAIDGLAVRKGKFVALP